VSRQLIGRSPALTKLRTDGYDIQVHPSNHMLVNNVPYVTAEREVAYGTLIVPLTIEGGAAGLGPDHRAYFRGGHPQDNEGKFLGTISHSTQVYPLGEGLVADHMFSAKPPPPRTNYDDLYELASSYVDTISKYARRIDDRVTAQTGHVADFDDEPDVFAYRDSASSRAGIGAVTDKLRNQTIAIIGLGGTGSYVLDLVAKTPAKEIRLYDRDRFSQHNAFRAPGAASKADVEQLPPLFKVDYFKRMYSAMHLNITTHPVYVERVDENFGDVDFTFICIDKAAPKRLIVESLQAMGKPFVDVGMGVQMEEATLSGTLRTTFSTNEKREHLRNGIPFVDVADDDYALNIQIAELNAINAALAVVRWKKHLGFYYGRNPEYSCLYTIDWNRIDNGDFADAR
jgi:hypothetical protein